jgi:hypothetical protein
MKRQYLLRSISLIVVTSILFFGGCSKNDDSNYNNLGSKVLTASFTISTPPGSSLYGLNHQVSTTGFEGPS